jgi:TetR/AcrR family fatty acid metabolism transcriptional regulator
MRKKEGNKAQAILDASVKVFAKSGFHNAKVAEIASLANVATGSVYVYYKDKEDLILKIFSNVWERLVNELKIIYNNSSFNPVQKFDAMIDLFFDVLSEDLNLALVFINDQSEMIQRHPNDFSENYENFFQLGETIVRDGVEGNFFSSELNVKNVRAFLFGGMRHLLQLWATDHETFKMEEIRCTVKILTKNGLLMQ